MTASPATVKAIFDVSLARPRDVEEIRLTPTLHARSTGRSGNACATRSTQPGQEESPVSHDLTDWPPKAARRESEFETETDEARFSPGHERACVAAVARLDLRIALVLLWLGAGNWPRRCGLIRSSTPNPRRSGAGWSTGSPRAPQFGSIWTQIYTTLQEAVLGFVIGTVAGVVLGMLLGRSRFCRRGAGAVHQGRSTRFPASCWRRCSSSGSASG